MKKRLTFILMGVCTLAVLLACVACAPQKQETTEGGTGGSNDEAETPAVVVDWSPDSDCAMCHTVQASSMEDSACLAKTHADQGKTCIDCHTDTAGMETAHAEATQEAAAKIRRLKETEITKALCLSSGCHVEAELAEVTAASEILTDSSGTVVNPHAVPESENHSRATCASCHVEHAAEPIEETAPSHCLSCHHADVYECNTCHDA